MDAIIKEFPIDPFPFDDETKLEKMAQEFKNKSTGGMFENVVGTFDGYLLRINKAAVTSKRSGIKDPSTVPVSIIAARDILPSSPKFENNGKIQDSDWSKILIPRGIIENFSHSVFK